ncbi:MAG: metallophosphoesterase [Proteobacteria bacterium]|nr:metallophosphoesterase [Pseudomonadota bacterium]
MSADDFSQWAARRRAIAGSRHWVSPKGPRTRWRKAIFNRALALFGLGLRLTPLHARGRRNALDLRRIEIEVALPGLPPAFDGYRLLHVSDTHLDVFPEIAEAAHRLLDGLAIDLLAVTGDVHGDHRASIDRSTSLLMRALRGVTVRGPRLAVLGNHDAVEMAPALSALGFEVLINRSVAVEKDGQRLIVTGLDDVHNFYSEAARFALRDSGDAFRIALVHSAEMADHAAEEGYALYLSGHTHGGQICLPGGRPLVTQLVRCRHAAVGLWRHGRMVGYTSSGLGVSEPAMRFNCRGEVALITLRRTDELRPAQ